MSLARPQRAGLVDQVISQLRDAIESGRWKRGERLPTEDKLTELLGVGRNTVREAVRALVHAGMLEVHQGDGTYVRSDRDAGTINKTIHHATLRDLLEVRRALEVEAARLAAARRTDQDLDAIRTTLAARGDWEDPASLTDFVERDGQFHLNVVNASQNPALIELYRYFWSSVRETIARTEDNQRIPEPSYEAHKAICEAIQQSDPEAAAQAAFDLLSPAIDALGPDVSEAKSQIS